MLLARPLPIYAADARIADLEPSELFVICIARLWVLHYRDPDGVPADWRAGFAHMHIDADGEAGFDALLASVAASAIRRIDIRCKGCPHLGDDEAWLLQLIGALQDDCLAQAAAILADWLPAGAVRRAIGPAQVFAAGLAARGLVMQRRSGAAIPRHSDTAQDHACASHLLH
jgi:hypothetical protein